MGMSASQARLIALTARMSDVEYEGQQINQQRLVISNQMTAIFSALAEMEVPTPPSKLDFRQKVYKGGNYTIKTGKDGRLRVFETLKQQNIVQKGSRMRVGVGMSKHLKSVELPKNTSGVTDGRYEEVQNGQKPDFYVSSSKMKVADKSQLRQLKDGVEWKTVDGKTGFYYGDTTVQPADALEAVSEFVNGKTYFTSSGERYGEAGISFVDISTVGVAFNEYSDGGFSGKIETKDLKHGQEVYIGFTADPNDDKFKGVADEDLGALTQDQLDYLNQLGSTFYTIDENNNYKQIFLHKGMSLDSINGIMVESPEGNEYFSGKGNVITVGGNETMSIDAANDAFKGNSTYETAITSLRQSFPPNDDGETQYTDFTVVISQDKDGNYSFSFCLTADMEKDAKGTSAGGDGYTTVWNPAIGDLDVEITDSETFDPNSVTYDGTMITSAVIDGKTVTFGLDTVFDQDAYEIEFQKYQNAKAVYDDEQNRLNKQTSIYQRQDKQLDLKLKRLDTERNALNTEIDAVKKVIQDATDKGFKTFSG